MSDQKQAQGDKVLACDVCLTEIPESGSASDEASDYVRHFCGLECYQQWQAKKDTPQED